MTPAQQVRHSCRRTSEIAAQLRTWLKRNQGSLAPQSDGLDHHVDAVVERLGALLHAADDKVRVGVHGCAGEFKLSVTNALLGGQQFEDWLADGSGQAMRGGLSALIASSCSKHSSVMLQLTAARAVSPPAGYPIAVTVLDRMDLVKICARAFWLQATNEEEHDVNVQDLRDLVAQAESEISARTVAGFTARDAQDLAEHLHSFSPCARRCRQLSAQGYWDVLRELGPHMSEPLRRRLVAMLWNGDPKVSAIYERLDETLRNMGYAHEVAVSREAVLVSDPRTGWLVAHDRSVIDAGTIAGLALEIDRNEDSIGIATAGAARRSISRSCLAALIKGVIVPVGPEQSCSLQDCEIVVFPSLARVRHLDAAWQDQEQSEIVRLSQDIQGLFAEAKASYLAERAVEKHEISALVVCASPSGEGDDLLVPATARWVEAAHGSEPLSRERSVDALFIAIDEEPASGEPSGSEQLLRTLREGLAPDQDWLREWKPGRGFQNLFVPLHSPSAGGLAGERQGEVVAQVVAGSGLAVVLRRAVAESELGPSANAIEILTGRDGVLKRGFGRLNKALAISLNEATRQHQIGTQLDLSCRQLSGGFQRYLSGDVARSAEWRRRTAHIARGRLVQCAERGRLGLLLQALQITEQEVGVLLDRMQVFDSVAPTGAGMTEFEQKLATAERIALNVTGHWVASARRLARSSRLARSLMLPQSTLLNVSEELIVDACASSGAVSCIRERLALGSFAGHGVPMGAAEMSVIISRILNVYVETLSPPGEVMRSNEFAFREVAQHTWAVGVTGALNDEGLEPLGSNWPEGFVKLVERNIAASSSPMLAADQERELSELLSALSTQLHEVDQ